MGRLKLEHLYRVLPNNRTELIEEVKKLSTVLQLREAAHEPGVPHTGCGVFKQGRSDTLTYRTGNRVPNSWDRTVDRDGAIFSHQNTWLCK